MSPPYVHCYGQANAQSPVQIVGTTEGLLALLHAITSALLSGTNQRTPTLYTGADEPYEVAVTRVDDRPRLARFPAPWTTRQATTLHEETSP